MTTLPTSLYIHMPWCIKKCPYCDFNSHQAPQQLPEARYINALVEDFKQDIASFGSREISSVFIGGGTPSLFSGESYKQLFERLQALAPFQKNLEITLEANPGAVEQARFETYRKIGINRLSLGVQSFHDASLKKLGRIHGASEAKHAIQMASAVGFDNLNVDLMYGVPDQSVAMGLSDLQEALSSPITHLSWYQFTLEPNTYFHKFPPRLPPEETLCSLEEQGYQLLNQAGFKRYEISAFHSNHHTCQHNLNYWTFGDYFGIGAGAHGKLTDQVNKTVTRTQKTRLPKSYLASAAPHLSEVKSASEQDLIFEFMLNATRLEQAIPLSLFTERTALSSGLLMPFLHQAEALGWIELNDQAWKVTPLGRQFTNDLQSLFL
jgi:putative oxygen-independent coproporphyrinogen III oxidase